nr:hypothetical protein NCPCFENI_00826 [Cupriavidus sp.]
MDLAHVVADAGHLNPVAIRVDHAPACEVIDGGAPEHGLFPARIHGDVASHTGGICRGGVHGKDQARRVCGIRHPARDHAGSGINGCHRLRYPRQLRGRDRPEGLELFGINHYRLRCQGDGATGVAGASTPRNDGQAQSDTGLYDRGHFGLRVRRKHHAGVLHPPVGGIGDMRDTRQAIELDVLRVGDPGQGFFDLLAQDCHLGKRGIKPDHGLLCQAKQFSHTPVTGTAVVLGCRYRPALTTAVTAFLDLCKPMAQGLNQLQPSTGIFQKIVLQVGVTGHHPDVSNNLVEHARRTASFTLLAQF